MKVVLRKIGRYSDGVFLNLKDIIPEDWSGYVTVTLEKETEDEIVLRVRRVQLK